MIIRTLAAAALLSAPVAASADALLDRLLADSRNVAPEDFAWTRTTRSERRGGTDGDASVVVERYDPSKPAAQRWTLVSIDGKPPEPKQLAAYAKSRGDAIVPSYGRIAKYIGGARRDEATGRPVYRAAGLPAGSFEINGNDLSKEASVEAVVADGPKPYVERMRLVSAKPFRMMLVAKVERVEATSRYKLLPDGRPVVAEQVSEMRGSMMGKSGTMRSVVTYSDHRPVR